MLGTNSCLESLYRALLRGLSAVLFVSLLLPVVTSCGGGHEASGTITSSSAAGSNSAAANATEPGAVASVGTSAAPASSVSLGTERDSPAATHSSPPTLAEIQPASGPAGAAYPVQAILVGNGFTATENAVTFGPVVIEGLASTANGTRISFVVPKVVASRSEVPPLVLVPGEYLVRVSNSTGTSNPAGFLLTVGP